MVWKLMVDVGKRGFTLKALLSLFEVGNDIDSQA